MDRAGALASYAETANVLSAVRTQNITYNLAFQSRRPHADENETDIRSDDDELVGGIPELVLPDLSRYTKVATYQLRHHYSNEIYKRISKFMKEIKEHVARQRLERDSATERREELNVVGDLIGPIINMADTATSRINTELAQKLSQLNTEQRFAYDLITSRLETQYKNVNNPLQRLAAGGAIIITGSGGNWQTFLIQVLELYCQSVAETALNSSLPQVNENVGSSMFSLVAKMAYTGAAAYLLRGRTLHAAMNFPQNLDGQDAQTIDNSRRQRLEDNFRTVRLIVIDEISMVSTSLFYLTSKYLRAARTDDSRLG